MIGFVNLGSMGRLGNQMFQFATLYGVGKKLGYEIGIPHKNTICPGEFQRFALTDGFELDLSKYKDFISSDFDQTFGYYEAAYQPQIWNISDRTNLDGYFQSPKYFEHCKDDIVKFYTVKQAIREEIDSELNELKNKTIVTIHVRRTDFVNNIGIDPTPLQSYMSVCQNLPENSHVFVFSDDVAWCRLFFPKFLKHSHEIKTSRSKFHDLYVMTRADINILANSTFSWWGAYLNTNNSKVYIPKKWYKNDDHSREFYLDSWETY